MIASTQQVSEWLSNFGTALDRADFDAAARMFEEESYWRDLLSLTWNIKTLEGKENIKAMLEATVPEAKPGQWRIEGNATRMGVTRRIQVGTGSRSNNSSCSSV